MVIPIIIGLFTGLFFIIPTIYLLVQIRLKKRKDIKSSLLIIFLRQNPEASPFGDLRILLGVFIYWFVIGFVISIIQIFIYKYIF